MCRWLAYSGSPVLVEGLLYKPKHSLIDQSRHARMGVDTTNGDGFGVGWYSPEAEDPAVFRSIEPASTTARRASSTSSRSSGLIRDCQNPGASKASREKLVIRSMLSLVK